MKSSPPEKKKKVKLQISDEINFKLLGISSHENDYRLVWAINHQLGLHFSRVENLTVHQAKLDTDLEFSRFLHTDEDRILTYYLISNRCPDGFLFPEIMKLDYLLQIVGEAGYENMDMVMKEFKKIDIISAVFLIDPKQLKGIERIISI
jgi:hypothetical protein